MKNNDEFREGAVSQWNEGNLKSLRLHEAQEIINFSKINPLKKTNGEYNYQLWIYGVTILYGEGCSKYGTEEIEEVERIKEIINKVISAKPPIKTLMMNGINKSEKKTSVNYENWENLRRLIEIFEQKVKYFNDKHGLSTRNIEDDEEGT